MYHAFIKIYKNSESLGVQEMLWEHELQASSFFKFSQTFKGVSIEQLDYELEISITPSSTITHRN